MSKPTPKQAQVLGLVKEGKTPKQIAKTMKISPNGVYAHLRKLRERGLIEIAPSDAAPEATSNGHSADSTPEQIKALARQAADTADERVSQIEARLKQIAAETDELRSEGVDLEDEVAQLHAQRKLLDQVQA